MLNHIDFSQYSQWMHCSWAWLEKYVNKRSKAWPAQMRDDALAIGSLVHNGLDNWYAKGSPEIDEEVIKKINPTPDCLRLCRKLGYGYVQTFPKEAWQLIQTEAPLRFELIEGKDGLAKLDLYFYISEPTVVDSGLPGYKITLKPGWWIQEYKTKSQAVSVGDFMQSWVTNMQADFQMLALQENIGKFGVGEYSRFDSSFINWAYAPVNGLLVNVIEKPNTYVPKRKCKGLCQQYWPYASWLQGDNGQFKCPNCGNQQKLKPLEEMNEQEPRYFRMIVERTAEQLAVSRGQIIDVAQDMAIMELELARNNRQAEAFEAFTPNKLHCYDLSKRYAQECEYYRSHTYGLTTIDNPEYRESEDYIGEKVA